jgi:hypothetical protein
MKPNGHDTSSGAKIVEPVKVTPAGDRMVIHQALPADVLDQESAVPDDNSLSAV